MEVKGSDLKKPYRKWNRNDKIGWLQSSGLKVKYDLKQPFG